MGEKSRGARYMTERPDCGRCGWSFSRRLVQRLERPNVQQLKQLRRPASEAENSPR